MIGEAPPQSEAPLSDPEGQFWTTFEKPLNGCDWGRVEQLLGKRTSKAFTCSKQGFLMLQNQSDTRANNFVASERAKHSADSPACTLLPILRSLYLCACDTQQ
ncbi:MAG TPA: hypothetical protein VEZ12_14210, partial [Herpetosiphonaceae bacterium]|nr:hypothetical protein [Herpetosiphonaceae bacterium]